MMGLEGSAIGTVVERTTRFTILVHLPRESGHGHTMTPQEWASPRRLRSDQGEERSGEIDEGASRKER